MNATAVPPLAIHSLHACLKESDVQMMTCSLMLDAGCWMLDAGCWMLDADCAAI